MLLLVDANVLIDHASSAPEILEAIIRHLGPIHVPRDVLAEVPALDEGDCERIGIAVVDGSLEQILEAGAARGPLSFADRICLILARDNGWTCVTNDVPRRRACAAEGIPVMWGLELMLKLVASGRLTPDKAVAVAEAIAATNPCITSAIVADLRAKAAALAPLSEDRRRG